MKQRVLSQTPNSVFCPDPTPPARPANPAGRRHRDPHGTHAIVFHPMSHRPDHTRVRRRR